MREAPDARGGRNDNARDAVKEQRSMGTSVMAMCLGLHWKTGTQESAWKPWFCKLPHARSGP